MYTTEIAFIFQGKRYCGLFPCQHAGEVLDFAPHGMTRTNKFLIQSFYPLADLTAAGLFAYFSPHITNWVAPWFGWSPAPFFNLFTASPFLAGAALMSIPVVLRQVGFYHKQNMQRVATAAHQLFSFAIYYLCAMGLYTVVNETSFQRSQVLLINLIGIPVVIFARYLIVRLINLHRADAESYRRQIIIAGSEEAVRKGWDNLPEHWRKNFNVAGRFLTSDINGEEVQDIIEKQNITALYVFGGLPAHHNFSALIEQCEVQGIDVNLVLRDRMTTCLRVDMNEIGDSRMIVLSSTPEFSWSRACKGILDRLVALCILICSSPLWLIAAIGIKISDPKGPIFFRQRRSGLYGRVFHMWKFRSMYIDAEARLDEIKAKYGNEMNGPIFKLTNDPRVFKFGHFIRKTSIDELPQLLNILTGDMSIVGPRPLPVYETEAFPKIEHRRRLSVKPGLTCFWQIEDRSDNGDFDNMVTKDLRYIDEWSLWLDVKLFFRTIPAVLFRKGAK